MGILAPGVGPAALRDDGTEVGICQDIDPWRGRSFPLGGRDHIFMAVAREAPQPVPVQQVALGRRRGDLGLRDRYVASGSGGRRLHSTAALELVGERASLVVDDDTGDGLQQGAILIGHLIRAADEDAA